MLAGRRGNCMSNVLKLFVNREKQTAGFVKILEGQTPKRVMIIEAPGGLGKSWAIEFMRLECQKRSVPYVEIDFSDGIVYDFLTILRCARDSFGGDSFTMFNQEIARIAQPVVQLESSPATASINIGDNANIASSNISVGDVGTVIKDSSIVINADNPIMRQALQDSLFRAFFEGLGPLIAKGPLVFFFDTYDKVTVEAQTLLLTYLLPRIRQGRLTNTLVVVAGRSGPALDTTWTDVVAKTDLERLKIEHVTEYLLERCGLTAIDPAEIEKTFLESEGLPQMLALLAEKLSSTQPKEGDDDWL